ncbi:DUF6086 family protein [Dactylosporangium cerinum]|uniref:DUF6086 family protein n=1 Tax=Dactylosporangium cerinum TaxID=1434730 RepID=A0ABV9WB39_9ACTN
MDVRAVTAADVRTSLPHDPDTRFTASIVPLHGGLSPRWNPGGMGMIAYVDRVSFWEPGMGTARMFVAQVRLLEDMVQRSSGIRGPESDELFVDPLAVREFLRVLLRSWSRQGSVAVKAMTLGVMRMFAALDQHLNGSLSELDVFPEICNGVDAALLTGALNPMPWGPPAALDLPQSIRYDLAAIVQDLAYGRYPTIEERTEGRGLSAERVRAAVTAYPIPLAIPPERIPPDLTSTVDGPHRVSRMSLWDTVYGPSRLRLEVAHDVVGHRITRLGFGDP